MLKKFINPLELSTLNGANGFSIQGVSAADVSGWSVASAGDINGDGASDLIIGAPSASLGRQNWAGASYVVFGSRTGFSPILELASLDGVNGFSIPGVPASDRSGTSVASAGDINGDGVSDLIIGTPRTGPNYVIFGRRTGFSSTLELSSLNGVNGFSIYGVAADDWGSSVASAGDINGDGISDMIVGAPSADPGGRSNAGTSYVIFGRRTGFGSTLELSSLNGVNGFSIQGVSASEYSGWSVASAGDINGDGISDLLIGARYASPGGRAYAGASYVVFGSRAGFSPILELSSLNGINGFSIYGASVGYQSGYSVASAGDINGDGISDLIIGAWQAAPGGRSGAGASYVVFGSRAGFSSTLELFSLNGVNGFSIRGVSAGDNSGYSVAAAGDLNGDGISDVIIGAQYAASGEQSRAGASYVVFGNRNGFNTILELSSLNGWNGFAIPGISAGDYAGCSVASAGDINGDGISDVIIGSYGADRGGRNNTGASYVIFGGATLLAPSPPTFRPTLSPTLYPTLDPVPNPTLYPTPNPTFHPTLRPTFPFTPPSGLPGISPTSLSPDNSQISSSLPGIIGGVVGGLVALIGAGAFAYRYYFKKCLTKLKPPSDNAGEGLDVVLLPPPKSPDREPNELKFSVKLKYREIEFENPKIKLGEGAYGIVYKARYRNNPVAVKQLKMSHPSSDSLKEFQKEMAVMANLRCPQVVQFYGVYFKPAPGIVMEYMTRGSLYQVIHSGQPMLSWTVRLKIARDITCGLSFLHQENIIHRDLKSLNVLLNEEMQAKLTDFGLAKIKTETISVSQEESPGTLLWMAPELFKRGSVCTQKSDVYSLGITLWELAAYKRPFDDAENDVIAKDWIEKGQRELIPKDCPPPLARAITWCWDGEAAKRPSAQKVLELLEGGLSDCKTANDSYQGFNASRES